METMGKMRRRHKVHGERTGPVASDLNFFRNTVKKYLKAEADAACQFYLDCKSE